MPDVRGRFFFSQILLLVCLWLSFPFLPLNQACGAETGTQKNRWESAIEAFEASDRTNPPPQNAILFIGASNIRLWTNLGQSFPGHKVFNRGFGGAQMSDLAKFANRIVIPYKPKMIFLYAGDNDIASGKSPEQVLTDFKAFTQKVHATLPRTVIGCIAIKPSPSREKFLRQVDAADMLVREYCRTNDNVIYLDVFTPLLNEKGQPRPELFGQDGLHLNEKGRAIWVSIIKPVLDRYDPPSEKHNR